jgi:tRNA U54 and U55 pseudouridine synthase Pus10
VKSVPIMNAGTESAAMVTLVLRSMSPPSVHQTTASRLDHVLSGLVRRRRSVSLECSISRANPGMRG